MAGLRFAVLSPALWRLSAVYALKSCAAYALIFWTPIAIDDLLGSRGSGHGPPAAVLLTAVPYTFAAATAVAVGWSSHVRGERRLHTAVPFAVGAAILLSSPLLQVPLPPDAPQPPLPPTRHALGMALHAMRAVHVSARGPVAA